MPFFFIPLGFACLTFLYLWHVNRAMQGTPPKALELSPKRWTKEVICKAYKETLESPTDTKKYLPPRKGHRYIVVGGSGLVGGWIVQHLVWRGEDPSAIRIVDLKSPTRPEVADHDIQFFQADVADQYSVSKAFEAPWPNSQIAKLPLTVFHTVAYIKPSERKRDFLDPYIRINISGTQHVLNAAKSAGSMCFIATSSASIGVKPPKYFLAPWRRWPQDIFQVSPNAEPKNLDGALEDFGSCYSLSKARAERIVRDADDKAKGFRTGCIRPGHAIYGHGVENASSISWDYLRRGGSPSWLWNTVCSFVNAQNVSIAHLAFEARLTSPPSASSRQPGPDVGGRAYCCTDPNSPITFGDAYTLLSSLAHSTTPVKFPVVPPVLMLLLAYFTETYSLLRLRYMGFLPEIQGDIALITPAMFNMSTAHVVYDDHLAREELGYRAPLQSIEGFCLQLVDWNEKAERRFRERELLGKGGGAKMQDPTPQSIVHAVPFGVEVER